MIWPNDEAGTRRTAMIVGLLCLMLAAPARAADLAFTRGPFVQNATPNSMQLIWRTDAPASTFVEYGLTTTLRWSVTNNALLAEHVVTLSNLLSDATYYYRAGSANENNTLRSAPVAFRTFKTAGPVQLLVVGDSRNGTGAPNVAAAMASTPTGRSSNG